MSGSPYRARAGEPPAPQRLHPEPIVDAEEVARLRREIASLQQRLDQARDDTDYFRIGEERAEAKLASAHRRLKAVKKDVEKALADKLGSLSRILGYNISREALEAAGMELRLRNGLPIALPLTEGDKEVLFPLYPNYRYLEMHIAAMEGGVEKVVDREPGENLEGTNLGAARGYVRQLFTQYMLLWGSGVEVSAETDTDVEMQRVINEARAGAQAEEEADTEEAGEEASSDAEMGERE